MNRILPESIIQNTTVRRINVKSPTLRSDNTSLNLATPTNTINKNSIFSSLKEKWDNSKPKKFIESNSYIQYDTVYSKILIGLTIMKIALAIAFIIFYTKNCGAQAVYVSKDIITEEFKEKNKKYNEMNSFNKIDSIFSIALGGSVILFTTMQFIYMYNNNNFEKKDIDFNQI